MIKMALRGVCAILGFLCVLANFCWGGACGTSQAAALRAQAQQFIDLSDPEQVAYVLDVYKADVDDTLYCGFVARLFDTRADESAVNVRAMCFRLTKTSKKGSHVFKGFCLDLYPSSTRSQIGMEFRKNAFVLHINEYYVECDHEHYDGRTLTFELVRNHNRYILQTYSRDNDDGSDPFYRQKRDGKRIFMDQINGSVLENLENHCYKKHYCQTWEEKNGIE
nr:hypothetical protein [Helicobacter baculiformis]